MIQTGSSNITIYIEDGEEVYPCLCGETHRGPYASYDYGHHTCPHGQELWSMDELGGFRDVLCSQCGATVGFLCAPGGKP